MHTGPAPAPLPRSQHRLAGLACGAVLALLGGCADVHWERAFYDGFQRCPPGKGAQNESCGKGPAYDRYDQERSRLQADPAKPASGNNPIEETQR